MGVPARGEAFFGGRRWMKIQICSHEGVVVVLCSVQAVNQRWQQSVIDYPVSWAASGATLPKQ